MSFNRTPTFTAQTCVHWQTTNHCTVFRRHRRPVYRLVYFLFNNFYTVSHKNAHFVIRSNFNMLAQNLASKKEKLIVHCVKQRVEITVVAKQKFAWMGRSVLKRDLREVT